MNFNTVETIESIKTIMTVELDEIRNNRENYKIIGANNTIKKNETFERNI